MYSFVYEYANQRAFKRGSVANNANSPQESGIHFFKLTPAIAVFDLTVAVLDLDSVSVPYGSFFFFSANSARLIHGH